MWDLGNRGFIALVSAFSGCVFLYNVWGPILILTISLLLTIYACYSLIINDSLLSPHALLLFDYCKRVSFEVRASFEGIADYLYQYIRHCLKATNRRFRKQYLTPSKMDRRRGSHYQLSSDSYPTRRESSSSKNRFCQGSSASVYNHNSFGKHTSTPIYPRNEEEFENQTFGFTSESSDQTLSNRMSPSLGQNLGLARQEDTTYFGTDGPRWNTSTSSKSRTEVGEKKCIEPISGPLLSSTRYNIDPKVYSDVTSPGLTARLTKYAAEASNKLAHQSQYRVGQFPKVNLHASPVPLINAKFVKTRMPATVKLAPPQTVRHSPPSRQQALMDSYQQSHNSYSSPNVAQALREISLKRHASREDVASDLAKKQRTDMLAGNETEVQDDTKQKRGREESLRSEEDISPQSKTVRPTKRTKTPSCYDIINSLSSSKHVVSGVKRKARDFSRSGTPDFEKHFKSLEGMRSESTETSPQVQGARPKYHRDQGVEGKRNNINVCTYAETEKTQKRSSPKGILKNNSRALNVESKEKNFGGKGSNSCNNGNDRSIEPVVSTESARLTHKLFMRAEPERNEKLRMLVEEQGNIRAKFTTDDVEEIKKEDIADMRQTSMKARLQSMFDAISGKASRINPDVVIQAEEASNALTSVSCPVTCATLNSSTTTTNVNTAPISTSAVAPSPGITESNLKSPKHVAFNLPRKEIPTSVDGTRPVSDIFQTKLETTVPSSVGSGQTGGTGIAFTVTSGNVSQPTTTNASTFGSIQSNAKNFDFGSSVASATSVTSSTPTRNTFTFDGTSRSTNVPATHTVSVTNSLFGSSTTATLTPSTVSAGSITTVENRKAAENRENLPVIGSQAASAAFSSPSIPSIGSGSANFVSWSTNTVTLNTPVVSSVPSSREQNVKSTPAASNNPNTDTNQNVNANMNTNTNASMCAMPCNGGVPNVSCTSSSSTTITGNGPPPMFVFGSKAGTLATGTKSKPVFAFGSAAENRSQNSSETFGTATTCQPPLTMDNTGKNANDPDGIQANPSTASVANVTSSAPKFTSPTVLSTFTFRGVVTSTANDGKAGFSFGNTSTAPNANTTGNSNVAVFTSGQTGSSATKFRVPSSVGKTPGQFASNSGSVFANSTSSGASIFGATTPVSQPIFGTVSNANGAAATTSFALPKSSAPPPIFGTNAAVTSNTTAFGANNSIPLFSNTGTGNSSSVTASTGNPVPLFASTTSTSASGITGVAGVVGNNNTASNIFSSTTVSATFAPASNIFGQTNSPSTTVRTTTSPATTPMTTMMGTASVTASASTMATTTTTNFKNGPVVFGNNSGPNLFGQHAATSPAFGTAKLNSTNSTATSFCSPNLTTSSTVSVPSFRTANTTISNFGSQPSTNAGVPSSGSQTFGIGTSIFGPQNTVGSPFTPSVSSGGHAFAAQNSSPSPAFGTVSNANASATFSDGSKSLSSPFGTQSSTFGGVNASTAAPTFRTVDNASNENNNSTGMFTFVGNQKPAQQASAFPFGNGNNASNNIPATGSGAVPFQFGATTSTNSGSGFNFSTSLTTPSINFGTTSTTPAFNASTPGTFSIGSGSTAPRSRNVRTRKPR